MPTAKGISKPPHTDEVKDLAVSLYVLNPQASLKDVAAQINSMYHFDPPLSYDSIGRWVQAKGEKMKRGADLIWAKRRLKYGKSGMKPEKRQALVNQRTSQWANPLYKKNMSDRMRKIPKPVVDRIVRLYAYEKKTPAEIRRTLKKEGARATPALTTIHQLLNQNQIPKHNRRPLDIIADVPCFRCLLNNSVDPFLCKPDACKELEMYVLTL